MNPSLCLYRHFPSQISCQGGFLWHGGLAADGGLSPRQVLQVREETSHWSRSSRHCALIGWYRCVATPAFLCHKDTAQGTQPNFLPLAGYLRHKDRWLPCRERIYYSRWCQQCNDPTYSRFFLCLPTYHSLFMAFSDLCSAPSAPGQVWAGLCCGAGTQCQTPCPGPWRVSRMRSRSAGTREKGRRRRMQFN